MLNIYDKFVSRMKFVKKAIIITIVLHSIILIGVPEGHGFGIMILFECISLPMLIKNGFIIRNEYPLDITLTLLTLVSLIGKLILISLLFSKNIFNKKNILYMSSTFIFISFILICIQVWNHDGFLFLFTLGSGIPFLMYLGRVLYLINKYKENNIYKSSVK